MFFEENRDIHERSKSVSFDTGTRIGALGTTQNHVVRPTDLLSLIMEIDRMLCATLYSEV